MTDRAQALGEYGSANVSDALRSLGKHFQAMDGGIRPVTPSARAAGPAFTVRCFPGATFALERALELAKPGDVLVVDGGGHADLILMGGLMSQRAHHRGIAGAVLDAAVRDIEDIAALGFPVFSRYICPRAGTFAEIGEWQEVICCGRAPVRPGDWIVADQNGVVVIPIELLDETVRVAGEVHTREAGIRRGLDAGRTLADAASATART